MKNKGIFKFIFILICILVIYFLVVLNINVLTKNYNGKTQEYENKYYMKKNGITILDSIRLKSSTDEILREDIEKIKNNKIIKNILMQFCDITEEKISVYIDDLINGRNLIKVPDDIYKEIIYICSKEYELAFTLDFKNIVYNKATIYDDNECWSYKEITTENKKEVYEKSKEDLEMLSVTEKFEFDPETIYIKYYNGILYGWDDDIYIVEDIKSKIKIEYEKTNEQIKSLQIGFEKANESFIFMYSIEA